MNHLHWEERGAGMPVLCLPGFGNARWIFDRLVAPLARSCRLILPDNRGMGRSPPATGPYELSDLADDALHVMSHLGCERFAVLGLSMGGFIAQLLGLKAMERVSHLVLLCTSSGGEAFRPLFPIPTAEQVQAIYQLEPAARVHAALAPAVCPMLHRYEGIFDYLLRMRTTYPESMEQVMHQFHAVTRFLQHPLPLEKLHCPTLLLSGDQDVLVPVANAQLLQKRLPQARMVVFPDTDHLFFLEKSQEVAQHIEVFLASRA